MPKNLSCLRLFAEWEKPRALIFTLPHRFSDWSENLESIHKNYAEILNALLLHQKIFLIMHPQDESAFLEKIDKDLRAKLEILKIQTNDTWVRDYAPLCLQSQEGIKYLDFGFNGWGLKYPANFDNVFSRALVERGILESLLTQSAILEGGSIESDGGGVIMTTRCLIEPNRNPALNKAQILKMLENTLGAKKILFLNHGKLLGDDTDGHIDTLARFLNPRTIAHVTCGSDDEHFAELSAMEEELANFRDLNDRAYDLVKLPMPKIYDDGRRLAASYANFLILDEQYLALPVYGVSEDAIAIHALSKFYKIIPINSRALISQNGSLHCASAPIY